jgi:hypothetical protein
MTGSGAHIQRCRKAVLVLLYPESELQHVQGTKALVTHFVVRRDAGND